MNVREADAPVRESFDAEGPIALPRADRTEAGARIARLADRLSGADVRYLMRRAGVDVDVVAARLAVPVWVVHHMRRVGLCGANRVRDLLEATMGRRRADAVWRRVHPEGRT